MTRRVQDMVTYCQDFDLENRLVEVDTLTNSNCTQGSRATATKVQYV